MRATEDPTQLPDSPQDPPTVGPPPLPTRRVGTPWLPSTLPAPAPSPPPAPPVAPRSIPEVVARGADLPAIRPRRRWIVLCFVLTFGTYLACIPRVVLYSSPPTGDQAFYLMVVASIVQDHDLDVANNYEQRDEDK